jgi:hypothetical protein
MVRYGIESFGSPRTPLCAIEHKTVDLRVKILAHRNLMDVKDKLYEGHTVGIGRA